MAERCPENGHIPRSAFQGGNPGSKHRLEMENQSQNFPQGFLGATAFCGFLWIGECMPRCEPCISARWFFESRDKRGMCPVFQITLLGAQ